MSSVTIIDQHKIIFPVVPNTTDFARKANSSFTSCSRDQFFEGQ